MQGRRSLVLTMLVVVVVTAGIVWGAEVKSSSPQSTALRPCTTASTWNSSEKANLIAVQKSHPATEDGPTRTITQSPYAYESLPTDLRGSGMYRFNFGPIPRDFRFGTDPISTGFNYPPEFSGVITPGRPGARVVQIGGVRYFQVSFQISGASCSGLRLWMS